MAKIIISSKDLQGPIRNGGVGAAFTEYAKLLKNQGHQVECLLSCEEQFIEKPGIQHWKKIYASYGVKLTLLDEVVPASSTKNNLFHSQELEKSYRVSVYIRHTQPDILIMGDYGGDAYFPFTAADRTYKTIVVIHGTSFWGKALNSEYIDDKRDLTIYDIELACISSADIIVHPSQYIMDWHRPYLDNIKGKEFAICNPIHVSVENSAKEQFYKHPIKTFAFVGRIEHRKGIDIFIAAATELLKIHPDAKFKIYGKGGVIDGASAFEYIERKVANVSPALEINTELGTAAVFERLKEENAILVFPSRADNCPMTILEAAAYGVPALIARCTGQVELVSKKYMDRFGFLPAAGDLFARMKEVYGQVVPPVATSAFVKNARRDIVNLLDSLTKSIDSTVHHKASAALKKRSISVCIPSMGRRMANLKKIVQELQSLYIKEIIIVNDGGNEAVLREFTQSVANCKVLSQPNRYPGAARNLAAKNARGEFLLFLDDDNRPEPQMVDKYLETLVEHNYDCVSSWFFVGSGTGPVKIQTMPGLAGLSDVFENKIADNNFIIRKEIFNALGGYKETWGVGYEDFFFLRQLIDKRHSLFVIPEPLFFYEQSATGVNNGSNTLAATLETMLVDIQRTTRVYAAALASSWVKQTRSSKQNIYASLNQYLSVEGTSPEALFLFAANRDFRRAEAEAHKAFDKYALRMAAKKHMGQGNVIFSKFSPQEVERILHADDYLGSFLSLLISHESLISGKSLKVGLRRLELDKRDMGKTLINQLTNAISIGAYIDAGIKLRQVIEHYSKIYVSENEDVVEGVRSGFFKSGWEHYIKVARSEPWRHFHAAGHILLAQLILGTAAKMETNTPSAKFGAERLTTA